MFIFAQKIDKAQKKLQSNFRLLRLPNTSFMILNRRICFKQNWTECQIVILNCDVFTTPNRVSLWNARTRYKIACTKLTDFNFKKCVGGIPLSCIYFHDVSAVFFIVYRFDSELSNPFTVQWENFFIKCTFRLHWLDNHYEYILIKCTQMKYIIGKAIEYIVKKHNDE